MDKKINISQRGYAIYYVDRAKVYTRNSTLAYSLSESGKTKMFNIPYLNTSILMLGPSTSITNEAVRLFSRNSGIIMFTGNNGVPPYANTIDEFTILESNSEYKPTNYFNAWNALFNTPQSQLSAAKDLCLRRIVLTKEIYNTLFEAKELNLNDSSHNYIFENFINNISKSKSIAELLLSEGRYTKSIYALCAQQSQIKFKRSHKSKEDPINPLLTHSNYLCYGYAAVTLTALGIPYSMPLLHGKTRRGALVFDIADLIKDAISIPMSFYHGVNSNLSDYEFRNKITESIEQNKLFKRLFDEVISISKIQNV